MKEAPPFDRTTTIIQPNGSWCPRHWGFIARDESVNGIFAMMRLITRTLELNRFVDLCYPDGYDKTKQTDIARINVVLEEIVPICCWLGDPEIAMLVTEARQINSAKPKS